MKFRDLYYKEEGGGERIVNGRRFKVSLID